MSVKVAIPAMLLLVVCACQNDTLEQGVPQLIVEAEPSPQQTRLEEPEGLDLGEIPLSSITIARFGLENRSTYALNDLEATIVESSGGEVTVSTMPTNLEGGEVSALEFWVKVPREESFEAVIDLISNAPIPTRLVLRGTGVFIGEPHLEVSWDAVVHPLAEECTQDGARTSCTTEPLNFTSTPPAEPRLSELQSRTARRKVPVSLRKTMMERRHANQRVS